VGGELGNGLVVEGDDGAEGDEDSEREEGADSACVLKPFTDVEADDVERDGNDEEGERDFDLEGAILREGRAVGADDVGGHGG